MACCGVLRRVAACCGVLRRVAACCGVLRRVAACCGVFGSCMLNFVFSDEKKNNTSQK
jgi:hypothetical protein